MKLKKLLSTLVATTIAVTTFSAFPLDTYAAEAPTPTIQWEQQANGDWVLENNTGADISKANIYFKINFADLGITDVSQFKCFDFEYESYGMFVGEMYYSHKRGTSTGFTSIYFYGREDAEYGLRLANYEKDEEKTPVLESGLTFCITDIDAGAKVTIRDIGTVSISPNVVYRQSVSNGDGTSNVRFVRLFHKSYVERADYFRFRIMIEENNEIVIDKAYRTYYYYNNISVCGEPVTADEDYYFAAFVMKNVPDDQIEKIAVEVDAYAI